MHEDAGVTYGLFLVVMIELLSDTWPNDDELEPYDDYVMMGVQWLRQYDRL
jgi:hypothetical protein